MVSAIWLLLAPPIVGDDGAVAHTRVASRPALRRLAEVHLLGVHEVTFVEQAHLVEGGPAQQQRRAL
jgi:hypothetical protein